MQDRIAKILSAEKDYVSTVVEFTNSKVVESVEYSYGILDDKKITERLKFKFVGGQIVEYYQYESPSKKSMNKIFIEILTCESIGKYWHKYIKEKLQYKIISPSLKFVK